VRPTVLQTLMLTVCFIITIVIVAPVATKVVWR